MSVGSTLDYLQRCQAARAAGYAVRYTTDPAWLVQQATNRRGGWPDDPGSTRGTARPLPDGRYPPKASGDAYRHLRLIAASVNEPRRVVRPAELGEWRPLLEARIPHRLHED